MKNAVSSLRFRLRKWLLTVAVVFSFLLNAEAHLGSPDVFYSGNAGPYTANATIRMPTVVPGRAEISIRLLNGGPATVSFLPLYSRTAVTNSPPPDIGQLVAGETNLYHGELWLMRMGGYSILVNVTGAAGGGSVEIPVNSVAFRLLPMNAWMGSVLTALGALIFFGGVAVFIGAAREATLTPGERPQSLQNKNARIVGTIALIALTGILIYSRHWWNSEEGDFRRNLRGGGWPDLAATVNVKGLQRILNLDIGERDIASSETLPLVPDHGKLMHLFLVGDGAHTAFAHLHPVRSGKKTFQVVLPPLPAGRYEIFNDLTLENSAMSSTATNLITLPPIPTTAAASDALDPDDDDSWAIYPNLVAGMATNPVFQLSDGALMTWQNHASLRSRQDARLQFNVRDASGHPAVLSPYLGMLSHAAVMKLDGTVFDHLHPMGNFSMAAQQVFAAKLAAETGISTNLYCGLGVGTNYGGANGTNASIISLPYEFPEPGDYRVWVQVKLAGKVQTAVFDAKVD